ncbi:MAG: membrane protein insertion efficiency factor YidD [Candidatus Kerfeldbacteria bacterium]|jgi:uncharacterized protein
MFKIIRKLIIQVVLKLIKFYQKTLSPDHGFFSYKYPYGYCRFRPTCSNYTYQAIEKYGLLKGGWMGMKRIIRCNPLNQGGEDPVK